MPLNTMELAAIAAALGLALPASLAASQPVPSSAVFTALPSIADDKQDSRDTFGRGQGHAGVLTVELDDDYDAVQIGVENQFTNAWDLSQVVLAPSASYGPDPVIGAAAYDLDAAPITQMVPVQWSHGGADSSPPGTGSMALPTAAAAAPGGRRLDFASTTAGAAYGFSRPGPGWYVADGLGCVASGTTVSGVTETSVTLSAPVTAVGCGAGQSIYFAATPFATFAQAVPAAASKGNLALVFSDWLKLRSLPRADAGYAAGAAVSGGDAVAGGTTLSAIAPNALMLSTPLLAALPAHAPVVISVARALSEDAPAGARRLRLADSAGIHAGQTLSGAAGVAAHTHVAAVAGDAVTIDQPTTAPIAATTRLGFSNTTWTSLPAEKGDTTLYVPSTSTRPLLHIRYFTADAAKISVHYPNCLRNALHDTKPCEAPLGLAPVWSVMGGQTQAGLPIDGVNYVSQIGDGVGVGGRYPFYPSFFFRFVGRHGGATLLICGGYQATGAAGSVSGEATPGRIAAAWASAANPLVPISAISVASHALSTDTDFANCRLAIDQLAPTMALIQDYSNHNEAGVAPYLMQVQAVAEHALQVGVQPIIYLAYVENSADVGALPVASAVTNSKIVPLATGLNPNVAQVVALVTGPGIPAGTSAKPVPGDWKLRLSQPATIPAGAIIHLALQVARGSGKSLALVEPSWLEGRGLPVSGDGIPPDTLIALTKHSAVATTSAPVYVKSGTFLQLAHAEASVAASYSKAAQTLLGATDPWDSVQLNAWGILGTDADHPTWLCDGCTTFGPYANDYGNSLIAAAFVPLLQQLTGQPTVPAPPPPLAVAAPP